MQETFPFHIGYSDARNGMWLLVDIGNSSIKVGLFDPMVSEKGSLVEVRRIEFTTDAELQLRDMIADTPIGRVGGVSVVPSQTAAWSELIERVCGSSITFFDESSRLPFRLTYETPVTMGNDRIAVALGGWTRYAKPGHSGVIVVDAGTAINYEVVTSQGEYPGGVIAPGPGLIRKALGAGTAQLPEVELLIPTSRIGRSTDEAIRSGIMFGMLDSVRNMVEGIRAEQSEEMEVVLTGGWGQWISERTGYAFEKDLVLKGVADLIRFTAG